MPGYAWIALIVAVVLAAAAVAAAVLVRRLRDDDIYVIWRTMFGRVVVFTVEDEGEPVRVLSVKGTYQSATYLDERYADLVFDYCKRFDCMFEAAHPVNRVLVIGGGGYAYPKHLVAHTDVARVDVVEIDPAITQIAQRYFFLDRLVVEYETEETGRLNLICADGRAYLDDCARVAQTGAGEADLEERYGVADFAPYDAIVNDSFSGGETVASLACLEAARSAHGCLAPGGLYLTNVVGALEGESSLPLRRFAATLGQVFAHVYAIPCGAGELAECDNVIVVATDGECRLTGSLVLR